MAESCVQKRQDVAGISALSWASRHNLYGNYICHNFQGGSWADRTPLHEAAFQGRLLSIMTLIAQGFNVNIVTMDGVSPLHNACLGGHVSCARFLLDNGAAVNAATIDGVTPLFSACQSGNTACVTLLLELSPDMHPAHLLASPLHEAVRRGHVECMEILLAHGVHIDLAIPKMGTPLHVACASQREDCVQRLLQLGTPDQPSHRTASRHDWISHLLHGCPQEAFSVFEAHSQLEFLLSGADVHSGRLKDNPLHAAARRPSVRVVELLLDYGANVWSRNAEGKRPVELAPANSAVEQVLLIREAPPALAQLCWLRIRRCLGPLRLHLACSLQIPSRMSEYLLKRC